MLINRKFSFPLHLMHIENILKDTVHLSLGTARPLYASHQMKAGSLHHCSNTHTYTLVHLEISRSKIRCSYSLWALNLHSLCAFVILYICVCLSVSPSPSSSIPRSPSQTICLPVCLSVCISPLPSTVPFSDHTSPVIVLRGCLGSKHRLTNYLWLHMNNLEIIIKKTIEALESQFNTAYNDATNDTTCMIQQLTCWFDSRPQKILALSLE